MKKQKPIEGLLKCAQIFDIIKNHVENQEKQKKEAAVSRFFNRKSDSPFFWFLSFCHSRPKMTFHEKS